MHYLHTDLTLHHGEPLGKPAWGRRLETRADALEAGGTAAARAASGIGPAMVRTLASASVCDTGPDPLLQAPQDVATAPRQLIQE